MAKFKSPNVLYVPKVDVDHTGITECRLTAFNDKPKIMTLPYTRHWRPSPNEPELMIDGDPSGTISIVVVDDGNCGVSPHRFVVGGVVHQIDGDPTVVCSDSSGGYFANPSTRLQVGDLVNVFIDIATHDGCIVDRYNSASDTRIQFATPEIFDGMIKPAGVPFSCRPKATEQGVEIVSAPDLDPDPDGICPGLDTDDLGDDDE